MICLVLPQKMSLTQCEIQSSCFTFVRVFAMVTITVMHLKNNAQAELIGVPKVGRCAQNLLILSRTGQC